MTSRPTRTISRDDLYDLVWTEPLSGAAARLGLSANGLAKMCDRLMVPRPARGHWVRGRPGQPRPDLASAPVGVAASAVIGDRAARRPRTRLSLENRREQLLDQAARVALADGLQAVTLKRLARDVGISEAQAHNCFAGRGDVMLTLARREIAAFEGKRRAQIGRGQDRFGWIVLTTLGYLHAAAQRGPLLQMLLRDPDVRDRLRGAQNEAAVRMRSPITQGMVTRYGMSRPVAHASTAMLTAVCLRAGGLIASGRLDLETAERLCLSIVIAGSRSNARSGAGT